MEEQNKPEEKKKESPGNDLINISVSRFDLIQIRVSMTMRSALYTIKFGIASTDEERTDAQAGAAYCDKLAKSIDEALITYDEQVKEKK